MTLDYPFTEEELETANREWGCNCGPSALAFALQCPLDDARRSIPDFERKRYTSPTMMRQAMDSLGVRIVGEQVPFRDLMFDHAPALVRIQWTGPWTQPGANPKWAYWHTHWIATWVQSDIQLVFDVNGGADRYSNWMKEIVPLLIPPRGDGGWKPTHIWRIAQPTKAQTTPPPPKGTT